MSRVVVCGEAWDKDSIEAGKPFAGASGKLLRALLYQAGIPIADCYFTNVFNFQPPGNKLETLCGSKKDGIPDFPSIKAGKYIHTKYAGEIVRLRNEVRALCPNLIVALGATAVWALTRLSGIRKYRGTTITADFGPYKILPTYHPAAVLRDYSLRPIIISDLAKCRREMDFADVRRPQRCIWIEPTIADLYKFEEEHINDCSILSIDVETKGDQITCFGVAPSNDVAIVVPLFDRITLKHYWSASDEVLALGWIKRICERRNSKVGQNFLYDVKFLWQRYGIKIGGDWDDTMLSHHALQPEMEKGLGFLGSLYTEESSWKFMRKQSETIKTEN